MPTDEPPPVDLDDDDPTVQTLDEWEQSRPVYGPSPLRDIWKSETERAKRAEKEGKHA